jgi:hypothetical protein
MFMGETDEGKRFSRVRGLCSLCGMDQTWVFTCSFVNFNAELWSQPIQQLERCRNTEHSTIVDEDSSSNDKFFN